MWLIIVQLEAYILTSHTVPLQESTEEELDTVLDRALVLFRYIHGMRR